MMSNVIKFVIPKPGKKFKGRHLCSSGFHKWEIKPEKQFDTKQGRLVTWYQCKRCGASKSEAH